MPKSAGGRLPGQSRDSNVFIYCRLSLLSKCTRIEAWVPLGGHQGVPSARFTGESPGGIPRGSPKVLHRFWVDSGLIQDRFWVDSGSILGPFWVDSSGVICVSSALPRASGCFYTFPPVFRDLWLWLHQDRVNRDLYHRPRGWATWVGAKNKTHWVSSHARSDSGVKSWF